MDPDNNLISLYHVIFGVQLDFFFPPNQGPQLFGKHSIPPPHSATPFPAAEQSQTKDSVAFNSLENQPKAQLFHLFFFFLAWMEDEITIKIH